MIHNGIMADNTRVRIADPLYLLSGRRVRCPHGQTKTDFMSLDKRNEIG
jgi:hypothetical protein